VRDGAGQIVRWVGANVEIHDQKEAEITLRRANHDLKQFVWAASHDLQEPLRMVVTFTDLLERQYAGALDPQSVQFARFAVEGASRMQILLKGLRDYWLLTEPGDDPAGRIDLQAVVEEAIGNLCTVITETSAVVELDHPLPVVAGSHTPLVQLFQNLLSNAIKYRHPQREPRITIRAARQGWDWLFCVEDNGIGIAEQYHEQVFGIFKRLHRFSDYAGSGIGLALCRTIVERHGGRIWVESQVDVGSRFYFTMPGVDAGK
jgi:light-regulated signal transduction histidine kinase (bacteriophytochrome)